MLEWYRGGETYVSLMRDCAELVALAAERAGATRFSFRGRDCDPFAEPERLSVADAFITVPDASISSLSARRPISHVPSAACR